MDSGTAIQTRDSSVLFMAKVSIASQYARCNNSFYKLLQILETLNEQDLTQRILDEFGRFRVWAENAGAHRMGSISLDYRLREASHVHEDLVELLEELNKNLGEAFKLMEDGAGSDSPHTLGEELIAELGFLEGQEVGLSEFEYLLSDIVHIISWLYKFSIAIRNPAPKERLHKIGLINVSHFEYWDKQHIDEKFRPVDVQNNFRVAEYLRERLARANTRRRQLLKYYEAHHKEVSQYIDDPLLANSTIERNELANASKSVTSMAEGGSASTSENFPTSKSVTTAPTVKVEQHQAIKIKQDEDQLSITSYATPTNHPMRTRVPSPPDENAAFEGKPFQCPYCFYIIEIRGRQDWKKHVFEDLQPYVCTFLDCPKADEMFGSQREWFDHQVQLHQREWYCDACSEGFPQETSFQEHIQMKHSELVTKEHFEAVISRSERSNVRNVVCPLCGIDLTFQTLEKHLGLHLQEVALFALPRPGPGDGSSESQSMEVGYSSECSIEYSSRKSILDFDSDGTQSVDQQIISPVAVEGIRCICSYQHNDGFLVTCGDCRELQHGVCMGINESDVPEVYECSACIPGAHHLEVEKAIDIQESFLKSSDQVQASNTDVKTEVPPQQKATPGPDIINKVSGGDSSSGFDSNRKQSVWDLLDFSPHVTEEQLEETIKLISSVDQRDDDGNTPLHLAASCGNVNFIELLRKMDKILEVDFNAVNILARTPLHYAAARGHAGMVEVLLTKGAKVNLEDTSGQTALHCAALGVNARVVEMLLEKRANPAAIDIRGRSPLHIAAVATNSLVVRRLIKRGGRALPTMHDKDGKTALNLVLDKATKILKTNSLECIPPDRVSISQELFDIIQELLSTEENRIRGWSSLHSAAHSGEITAVEILLKLDRILNNNSNPEQQLLNSRDENGTTPADVAACEGHWEIVRLLIENGCDASCKNSNHEGVLMLAVKHEISDIVEVLLRKMQETPGGGDIVSKEVDNMGINPLHWAAARGNRGIVVNLVHLGGAEPTTGDKLGMTALHFAALMGHTQVAQFLLQQNFGLMEARNWVGNTVLHCASEGGRLEIVKLLFAMIQDGYYNIDLRNYIMQRNEAGETALHCAARGISHSHSRRMKIFNCGTMFGPEMLRGLDPVTKVWHRNFLSRALQNHVNEEYQAQWRFMEPLFRSYGNKYEIEGGDAGAVALLLLKHGADIEATDAVGESPLHLTARWDRLAVAETLLQRLETTANSAQHIDSRPGDSTPAKSPPADSPPMNSPIWKKANVHVRGIGGNTPLHLAAMCGRIGIAKLLVEEGANVLDENNQKQSPEMVAEAQLQIRAVYFFKNLKKQRGSQLTVGGEGWQNRVPLHLC